MSLAAWASCALFAIPACGQARDAREAEVGKRLAECATNRSPNIVIIVADDLGWSDVGFNGSTFYETPNLDELAARGIRLTDFYAASNVCSPTRASLLTGRAPARLDMHLPGGHRQPPKPLKEWVGPAYFRYRYPRGKYFLEPAEYTLAEALRDAGYATAHVGKWHLGKAPEHAPEVQGFQVSFHATHTSGWSYFSPYRFSADAAVDGPAGEYLTDRQTDEAIEFIRDRRDRPFFLSLAYDAIHGPWEGKADLVDYYAQKAEPDGLQRNPVVAAMIHSLDENLGRLAKELSALGLAGCTVIAFTSDNGGHIAKQASPSTSASSGGDFVPEPITTKDGEIIGFRVPIAEGRLAQDVHITSNAPLRDGKSSPYEGGIRVPAFVVWPGVIGSGTVSATPAITTDLFPTMLEAAGVEPDPEVALDGISLMPLFRDKRPLGREALYWYLPLANESASAVIRQGRWKLIHFFERGEELYDLEEDLGETANLAARSPELAARLRAKLFARLEEVGARLPIPNPRFVPPEQLGPIPATSAEERDGSMWFRASPQRDDSDEPPAVLASGRLDVPGPIAVRLRMRSTAYGQAELYWADRASGRFNVESVVRFAVRGDGLFHTYDLPLDSPDGLGGLRLRLPPSDSVVEIDWLRITAARSDTILKAWEFSEEPTSGSH